MHFAVTTSGACSSLIEFLRLRVLLLRFERSSNAVRQEL